MIRNCDDPDLNSKYKEEVRILSIPKISSDVLAAHIVAYRAVGVQKQFAIICMQELARRRELGEEFNFETFIEEELAKLPKVEPLDIVSLTKGLKNNISAFERIIK